jgi:hypothetical protein
MLIQKAPGQNDIITIKLITGDELVAKLITFDQDKISITKPMLVTVGMDEKTGQVGIQMSPYFLMTADHDSNFTIKTSHIIVCNLASEAAKSGYIQNTSGLRITGSTSKGLVI